MNGVLVVWQFGGPTIACGNCQGRDVRYDDSRDTFVPGTCAEHSLPSPPNEQRWQRFGNFGGVEAWGMDHGGGWLGLAEVVCAATVAAVVHLKHQPTRFTHARCALSLCLS